MAGAAGAWAWHHTSVVVDDIDRAVAFHRDGLGFSISLEARGMAAPIQQMLGLSDIRCDLVQGSSPISRHVLEFIQFYDIPANADRRLPIWPGRSHIAFLVPDLDAAVGAITTAGGRPVGEITDFPEGPAIYCWAPGGGVIEFEQWREVPSFENRR